MKNLLISIIIGIMASPLYSQQMPFTEAGLINKYALNSAYAGVYNTDYLFTGYRQDWSGVEGSPQTYTLSYNASPWAKMGIGGKMFFDKTDIYSQFQLSGTYSYKLQIFKEQYIYFGMSMGFYRNSLDLLKYFEDPDYSSDPALLNASLSSKLNFTSDYSLVYSIKGIEMGVMFSNVAFGNMQYRDSDVTYDPFSNYQVHIVYKYKLTEQWDLEALALLRGGENISNQYELAAMAKYRKQFWGTVRYRTKDVIGLGVGAEIYKGVLFSYNYNLSYGIPINAFQNHEIVLGFNIKKLFAQHYKPKESN